MKYIIGELIMIACALLTIALVLIPMRVLDYIMQYVILRKRDHKFSQLKRLRFYVPLLISVTLTSCSTFKEPTTEQILIRSRVYQIMQGSHQ